MAERFTGWPERAFDVLLQLDGFPSEAVRERLRKDRERLVRRPMVALMQDIADADAAYDDFSVWGYGKTPWWWQHQCGIVRRPGFEIGMRFDLDGLTVSGSWRYADASSIQRYREAVTGSGGAKLAAILDALRAEGFEVGGERLKRGPRGFSADGAGLVRYRSLTAARPLGCDDDVPAAEITRRVLATYGVLRPVARWFAAVAPR